MHRSSLVQQVVQSMIVICGYIQTQGIQQDDDELRLVRNYGQTPG